MTHTDETPRPGILAAVSAVELCRTVRLSEEAQSLLSAEMTPLQYVRTLIDAHEYYPALRVLAQALPKREAVWWGTQCLWQTARPNPAKSVDRVLSAVVR